MSSTRRNPQARAIALSAAVAAGTAYFAITKYPCIKQAVLRMLGQTDDTETGSGDSTTASLPPEDNSPVLIDPDSVISLETDSVDIIDVSSASTDALKSWLSSKDISAPPSASHSDIVSLVESLQNSGRP